MKKQWIKIAIGYVVFLVLAIVLLVLSYGIPTGRLHDHMRECVGEYVQEGTYPSIYEGMIGRLDNYSEAIMVSTALTGSGNAWKDAFSASSYVCKKDGDSPVDAVVEQVTGAKVEKIKLRDYTRYWHGYVVWLKPLLYFFNLQELKILMQMGFGMLFGMLFMLLWKRTDWKMAVSFAIAMLLVCVQVVPYSLQYLNMFLLTFLGMLILLLFYDKIQKKDAIFVFFWIAGMCTGFFDLLTTPILVVGMLLILKILLDDESASLRQNILCGFCWCGGYGSMWASKWVIGSMVLGKNIIRDAVKKVENRTSGEALGVEVTVSDLCTVLTDLYTGPFMKKMLVLALIFAVAVILIAAIKGGKSVVFKNMRRYYVLLFVSLIPILWLLVLRNHTFIHFWFTYRNLAVFFWGILAYVGILSKPLHSAENE